MEHERSAYYGKVVEVYTPTLEDLVEGYTYLDGSPCGIEEDEE